MEYKTLNTQTISENVYIEKLTVRELISLVLDASDDFTIVRFRQELINRGGDNIQVRIEIKKTCKSVINDLEILLKRFDCESDADKKNSKLYKNKFLNTVSLLDKLQLEWQKHDLILIR